MFLLGFGHFFTLNLLRSMGALICFFNPYIVNFFLTIQCRTSPWVVLILIGLSPIMIGNEHDASAFSNKVIARISGEPITVDQLMQSNVSSRISNLKRQEYQLTKDFIYQKTLEVQASKKNMNVEAYLQTIVLSDLKISENETRAFYEAKKDEIPKEKTYEDVQGAIKTHLIKEKERQLIQSHIQQLVKELNVEILVGLPNSIRINPNSSYNHAIGPRNAPVQVIEFADFQCGYCKRAHSEFNSLMKRFEGKIHFTYRHFPLPNHAFSKPFAIASNCAGEQRKFFEFIALTYENQRQLASIKPRELATQLSLNMPKFEACMADNKASSAVEEDLREGRRIGINSTPTFIINGQIFVGTPKVEDILLFL